MQTDSPEQQQEQQRKVSLGVTVPESSPYELDQVIANYEGRGKILRLQFIASTTVSLAGPALTLALSLIKSTTLDVALYEQAFHQYRQLISALSSGEVGDPVALKWFDSVRGNEVELDRVWMDGTRREVQNRLDKLEVELKGYVTNLIKESIRMAHRDIAIFQYRSGDLQGALRSYTKSREYCSTSQHILEMCLGVIEVALDLSNYNYVRNYVAKAESALESIHAPSSSADAKTKGPVTHMPGMVAPAPDALETAKEKERLAVLERLTVASGVAHLGTGQYERAARAFTGIGRNALDSAVGHFIPPADIALYAVITSLATFDRNDLRRKVLENADLRPMLDLEPYLRDILRAFYASNFKEGLNLLAKHSARQELDVHLSSHLPALLSLIRSRALLSYFDPFATVSIPRMASSFGWSEPDMTNEVISLIGKGSMKARLDTRAKVLVAKRKDVRAEAFRNALEEGQELQKRALASHLRMVLIKNEILVKGPKNYQENA